jgi:acyl-CoA thioester hydrolase
MSNAFNWNIRVYYEDTDAGGIVYYANYLKFLERARTEWLRHAGVGQYELAQTHAVMFVVSNINLNYHLPAKLDDELTITVGIKRLGRASVEFAQQAWRGETLLVSGSVMVACVGVKTIRPYPIPAQIMKKIKDTI